MSIVVADIMSTRIVTIEMDDRLNVVKDIFEQANFHHLLVVDNSKLEGVLSERDLLRAISPHIGSIGETVKDLETLQKRVHQVMTRNPITVAPTVCLDTAAHLILEHNIGCLPVLDNGRLVGIITWKDLLRAYSEHLLLAESEC
ncbi:CBS domain-containing protein [Shewanella sp. MF08487]|uniref:CBS domain-containing protein n=1 Tax=Shewanella sp. MF08487 TaxID=3434873 RepID=UPI003D7967B3